MIKYILCALILVLDRLTKIWAVEALDGKGFVDFIKGFINLVYVENKGVAFGMLSDKLYVMLPITVVVIGICIFVFLKYKGESKVFDYAMLLIIAGAVGNIMDKLTRGFVVDFLNFEFMDFPVFNVADISVCTGAGLLIIYILFFSDKKKEAEGKTDDTDM
jgi:signal peptidase II